jgi:hypothetical protein
MTASKPSTSRVARRGNAARRQIPRPALRAPEICVEILSSFQHPAAEIDEKINPYFEEGRAT